MVERRQDAGRENRRTAALDQLDHRVQVERTVGRELGREIGLDTGPHEALLPPGGEVASGLYGRPSEAVLGAPVIPDF